MSPSRLNLFRSEILSLKNPEKIQICQSFFKTGKGQYGEGDVFYGITVPQQRKLVQKYPDLSLSDIQSLLESKIHEERLSALLILVGQFQKSGPAKRKEIYDFYLRMAKRVNNWDLVDSSAEQIVGAFLDGKDKAVLEKIARSSNVWERRISIIATFYEIKNQNPAPTLKIAKLLLRDEHDLIHKAVGWMLREVGKRCSEESEEKFLDRHASSMPRTMLRYAIERFSPQKRKKYLEQ